MSDYRLANLGDGGISDEAKAFALTLSDSLSYNARNMLADFITRSDARGTYIEDWLGEFAQELVDAGYLERLNWNAPYPVYAYTGKLLALRE